MSMKGRRRKALIAALAVVLMTPAVSVGATEGSYSGNRTSYNDTSGSAGGGTIFDRVSGGGSFGDTSGAFEVNPVVIPEETPTPEPVRTPAARKTAEPEAVRETPESSPTASPSESPEVSATPGSSPGAARTPKSSPGGTEGAKEMPSKSPGAEDTPEESEDFTGTGGAVEEIRPTPTRNPDRNKVKGRESTVKGVYLATAVDGCAVTTDSEGIAKSYGLKSGEEVHAKFSNLNGAEYPVAKKLLDMAAESQKAQVAASLSIEFGRMEGTKYSLLPADGEEIQILIGLSEEDADEKWTYAVAAVRRNGSVYILEDLDQDPDTVTFRTTAGAGAYALIRY